MKNMYTYYEKDKVTLWTKFFFLSVELKSIRLMSDRVQLINLNQFINYLYSPAEIKRNIS